MDLYFDYDTKEPEETEIVLMEKVPKELWVNLKSQEEDLNQFFLSKIILTIIKNFLVKIKKPMNSYGKKSNNINNIYYYLLVFIIQKDIIVDLY